jgi:hypothetical protein
VEYANRAFQLHLQRIQSELRRFVYRRAGGPFDHIVIDGETLRTQQQHDAMEYFVSGQAQEDVRAFGERLSPTLSGNKRTFLGKDVPTMAATATAAYDLVTLLIGSDWLHRFDDSLEHLPTSAYEENLRRSVASDEHVLQILRAVDSLGRHVRAIQKLKGGYSESSGVRTKMRGEDDSAGFATRSVHSSMFEGRCWAPVEYIVSSINAEVQRQNAEAKRDFLVVRAIERPHLDYSGDPRKQELQLRLQKMYETKTKDLQKAWDSLPHVKDKPNKNKDDKKKDDQVTRIQFETLAMSMAPASVPPFDLFCMRGVAGFLVGAVKPKRSPSDPQGMQAMDPLQLFMQVYCRRRGFKTLSETTITQCESLFSDLQRAVVVLNTERSTLRSISGFYRHRIFVEYLCEVALRYGTIKESKAANDILASGYCFLTQTFGRHPRESIRSINAHLDMKDALGAAESPDATFKRREDNDRLERLEQSFREGQESEERAARREERIAEGGLSGPALLRAQLRDA